MRQGVTFQELGEILEAQIYLKICSGWLWLARMNGQPRAIVGPLEAEVACALDRLWGAQQRAA